jgi:hypothetical protein
LPARQFLLQFGVVGLQVAQAAGVCAIGMIELAIHQPNPPGLRSRVRVLVFGFDCQLMISRG